MKKDEVIKDAARHMSPALVFHTGIVAKKASGVYVEDMDGKRYMDFTSGLATTSLGHCHPAVVEAAKGQLEQLIHSGCIFYYEAVAELAKKLSGVTPGPIDMFFFSNSGAEAVEGAIKLARATTGRQGIIAFTGGFHGRTLGAISLTTSSARYRKGYHPLLGSVFHSPYPYCFRCPMGQKADTCSIDCLEYLKDSILTRQITPGEVACVVFEPVLGEGGYVVPPEGFVKGLSDLCASEGILFIADEVQTGFGRTGRWFASEHFGLTPDIITMAKGIASGLPLSAVGAATGIMSKWAPGAHGTTFGGNPVSCAASMAVIDTIEKESLLDNVKSVGSSAMERLKAMKKKHPVIGDVRGLGLMIGIEFVKTDGRPDKGATEGVMERCLTRGLIIVECGPHKNVARLMPPLNTTADEMGAALDIFEDALAGL